MKDFQRFPPQTTQLPEAKKVPPLLAASFQKQKKAPPLLAG